MLIVKIDFNFFKQKKSIILSNLNRLDESFAIIEAIQTKDDWFMYDLNKKFFKLTLNTFRTCAQENPTLIQKFDILCEKINESNQLGNVDLHELATDYNDLKILKQDNNNSQVKVVNQNKTKVVNKNVPEASTPKPTSKGKQQTKTNQINNRQMSVAKNNPIKIGNKYLKFY
jgi:hypothetical protein